MQKSNIAKASNNDLIGQKFYRLLVVEKADDYITSNGKIIRRWKCKCDCGNEKVIRETELRRGHTRSCGCLQKEIASSLNKTHGLSRKCGRLYPLWKSIKYRCYNKKAKEYERYGGRGIKMCDEWRNDFKVFHDWAVANGYKEEKADNGLNILTIDRIDVNGNYEPSNCRFVTNEVQAKNKRNTITEEERYRVCPVCGEKTRLQIRIDTELKKFSLYCTKCN